MGWIYASLAFNGFVALLALLIAYIANGRLDEIERLDIQPLRDRIRHLENEERYPSRR